MCGWDGLHSLVFILSLFENRTCFTYVISMIHPQPEWKLISNIGVAMVGKQITDSQTHISTDGGYLHVTLVTSVATVPSSIQPSDRTCSRNKFSFW